MTQPYAEGAPVPDGGEYLVEAGEEVVSPGDDATDDESSEEAAPEDDGADAPA
jgi:hypothetical protein